MCSNLFRKKKLLLKIHENIKKKKSKQNKILIELLLKKTTN